MKTTSTDNIESRFLNDIKDHKLTILRNDGVYRHLRAARPDTSCYSFEIITFPGWLCYTGDMGSYTFQRLADMFQFFRERPNPEHPERLQINRGYWAEKVQAADRNGGIKEFSADLFRSRLLDYVTDRESDDLEALKTALEEEVLHSFNESDEREARQVAEDFEFNGEKVFHDLCDHNFTDYTHHFTWCCYAISWAVREFDRLNAERRGPAAQDEG